MSEPKVTFKGTQINITKDIGSQTYVKLIYQKNLETITRFSDSNDIITRLFGYGKEGLTIEGLDVSDLTNEELIGIHYELKEGKKIIKEPYIDSVYISKYAYPKEGSYEWSEIEDKGKLLTELRKKIVQIDIPKVTYEVQFIEFKNQGINFYDINQGDTITVIDTSLGIQENLKVLSIKNNDLNPELSVATLGTGRRDLLDFINDVNDMKGSIDDINNSNSAIYQELQEFIKYTSDLLNGEDSKVVIDDKGIVTLKIDTLGPNGEILNTTHMSKMANGALGVSTNGGLTYENAITPEGIVASKLIGQAIIGQTGRFEGINVTDNTGRTLVKLGKFKNTDLNEDTWGLMIKSGSLFIDGGLDKDQVSDDFFDDINNDLDELKNAFESVDNIINDAFSDDKLTSLEANQLKTQLNQFIAESVDVINHAEQLKIVNEKDLYSTSINDLKNYLEKYWLIGPFPMDITNNDRQIIQTKQALVAKTRAQLEVAINKASEEASKQFAIGLINKEMSEVNNAFNDVNDKLNLITSDLVITATEAEGLRISLQEFKAESEDVIKEAQNLNVIEELVNYKASINKYENFIYNEILNKKYPLKITQDFMNEIEFKKVEINKCRTILFNKVENVKRENDKKENQQAIDDANNALKDFENNIHNILFDGQVTQLEADSWKLQLNMLEKESIDLIKRGNALNLTNEVQNYQTAINDLRTYMNKNWLDKSYPLSISKSQKEAINTKFGAVKETQTELSNAITFKTSQTSKEELERELNELNNSFDDYKNTLDNMLADNKMNASEARLLKLQLEQLRYESLDIINIATELKITSLKTNYQNKLDELDNYMTSNWFNKNYPLTINEQQRLTIQEKFRQVEYAKSQLQNEITKEFVNQNAVVTNKDYNGVTINTKNGILVQRGDGKVRTILNATEGITIQQKTNSNWINQLYADINGNLHTKNLIATNITLNGGVMKDNEGNTLIDLANKIIDFGKFTTFYGKLDAKYIRTDELYVGSDKIKGKITAGQIDTDGLYVNNVTMGNNIHWSAGSKPMYSASEVGALSSSWRPKYTEILGSKPDIDANNTFNELANNNNILGFTKMNGKLYLNADYIKAGSISGDRITGGTIQGVTIRTGDPSYHSRLLHMQREVLDFVYNGSSKMSLGYKNISGGTSAEPYITFGIGDGNGSNNTSAIYKTSSGFYLEYRDGNGRTHGLEMLSSGKVKPIGTWDFSSCNVTGLPTSSGYIILD